MVLVNESEFFVGYSMYKISGLLENAIKVLVLEKGYESLVCQSALKNTQFLEKHTLNLVSRKTLK